MGSLMIEPIQRLPRYTLVFGDLIKKYPTDHPDYENVINANDMCRANTKRIEEEMERYVEQQKLVKLASYDIHNMAKILSNPARKYVKQISL